MNRRDELRAALLALTFLTVLPLPQLSEYQDDDFARASAYYPLAGYLVGGLVSLGLWLLLGFPPGVMAAVALAGWLAITGMLHFDGLVDSADGLLASVPPERRRIILKDVHVGAFGLAGGVLTLLLLWSCLQVVPPYAPLVAAVLARALVLIPMGLYPVAQSSSLGSRSRPGGVGKWRWLIPVLLVLPVLWLPEALIAAGVALGIMLLLARFAARRLGGGLTGDIYGLLITMAELAVLLVYS